MLSGPDLGGGFLHQLSLDEEPESTTFTFHAQDGGSDAGGPPKGPLDVFGYVHPPSPCMLGGPRCWHRRFRLAVTDAPRVRQAYNRGRFVLETMIGQAYGDAPAAVGPGTAEVVGRIGPILDAEGIAWHIGGSVAAWLQGARVDPHDLDLATTRTGVDRIAALLSEYLIEPVGPTDWPSSGIVHGARAFVGTFQDGLRVEWAVALGPRTPPRLSEWNAEPGGARCEPMRFAGRPVRAARVEYALVRAAEHHRVASVAALTAFVREHGVDRELWGELLSRSSLPAGDLLRLNAGLLG